MVFPNPQNMLHLRTVHLSVEGVEKIPSISYESVEGLGVGLLETKTERSYVKQVSGQPGQCPGSLLHKQNEI